MNTLELVKYLKTEQKTKEIKQDSDLDSLFDYSESVQNESSEIPTKLTLKRETSGISMENHPYNGSEDDSTGIQMEDLNYMHKSAGINEPLPKKKRKKTTQLSVSTNVYAKNTAKNNRSYADMDDEYSFLDADREELYTKKPKHKTKSQEPPIHLSYNAQVPSLYQSKPVSYIPVQNNNLTIGEDDVIISRHLFCILLSMNDVKDMSKYLNHNYYKYIYNPNSEVNQPLVDRAQESVPVHHASSPPITPNTPVVVPFEPKKCPTAICQIPLRSSLVQTSAGLSFLSNLIPENGFDG